LFLSDKSDRVTGLVIVILFTIHFLWPRAFAMLPDMKTFALYVTIAVSCCLTVAAQTATPPTPQTPAPKTAPRRATTPEMRAKILARTGGMLQSKAEGPKLLFLNAQKRVPARAIDGPIEQIGKGLSLSAIRKDAPDTVDPIKGALAALQDKEGVAAVVVVADSEGYPSLLIAPEARWAMVNVAALGGKDVSAATLADRTSKEVWRAFGYLMGAAHTSFEHCLLKTVLSPTDLDGFRVTTLCPEPFNNILAHAQALGMKPFRMTTYRKAVEEGWAPPPTNDFQKAIWEELRESKK
jgi:hypothetical protein